MSDISPESAYVLAIMEAMGWSARRVKKGKSTIWEFRRADTGGLEDLATVNHKQLSLGWLIFRVGLLHEPDMASAMRDVAAKWLDARFPEIKRCSAHE